MKVKLAESLFHGKEGYNCAQAILKAFQNNFGIEESAIEQASLFGGGRAEGGICGALHSALKLTEDQTQHQLLKSSFILNGDGITCKEIRSAKKLTCKECVKLAAYKLQENL